MDTVDLIKRVRQIEIKTKGLTNQIFSGDYHSAFKGRGMSFAEVREYQYGDDVRNIDWNVTARTNDPYIKQFEEERELTVMLVADVSPSVYFGSDEQSKNNWITELCAVIAFSAINNNDKVGLILFSDKVEKYIPPKKGKSHILRIIRELIYFKPGSSQTNISAALVYLNQVIKKRAITFLFSDFVSPSFEKPLRIAARRHDLISICIYDKNEKQLSNLGVLNIQDPETGKRIYLDTNSKNIANNIASDFEQSQSELKKLIHKSGGDFLALQTNQPYVVALHQFFKQRANRK